MSNHWWDDSIDLVGTFLLATLMMAGVVAALALWGIILYGIYKGLVWLF